MRAQGAAPGGGTPGHGRIDGNSQSIAHLGLSAHILETLGDAGISTLADWVRLGSKRRRIFGITGRVIALLDRAAREARS